MSAIAGIINFDTKPVDTASLVKMMQSMAHRGPDSATCLYENFLAFGHGMLHTTPEALHEKLPFIDSLTGLAITADARIDNRDELGEKLYLHDQVKKEFPDSRLILAAYLKWGPDCIQHLLGDFAFAIWNSRNRELFVARDHLGVKPFYYHHSDTFFVFASEVRGILAEPRVPKTINEPRIADFLVNELEGIDKTSTFYQQIFRLPPAHTISVSVQKIEISNYWKPDPEYELRLTSDDDYIEKFNELLTQSVQARLRCHGQPASMLSGGIDSSSIVGIARELMARHNKKIRVYSGISDDIQNCRENYFIQQIVNQGGLESVTVKPSEIAQYANRITGILYNLDEPFDTVMMLIIIIYLMAAEKQNRVVLDGVEGDMVHSLSMSYPAFLLSKGQALTSMREVHGLWKNYFRKRVPIIQLLWQTISSACTTDMLRKLKLSILSSGLLQPRHQKSITNKSFAKRIHLNQRIMQLRSHSSAISCDTIREKQVQNILHPYLTVALERYDRVASLCSVEPRHALLDKRLVEYSISLPWQLKARNGWSKYALRCASNRILPQEVSWRKGWEHVGADFTTSFMQKNGIHNIMLREIDAQKSRLSVLINNDSLKRQLNSKNRITPENEEDLWTTFSLALWLKKLV